MVEEMNEGRRKEREVGVVEVMKEGTRVVFLYVFIDHFACRVVLKGGLLDSFHYNRSVHSVCTFSIIHHLPLFLF